jgi:alpha-galactosidase
MRRAYKNIFMDLIFVVFLIVFATVSVAEAQVAFRVDGGKISIEFDEHLNSRIFSRIGDNSIIMGDFTPSEFVKINGKDYKDFQLRDQSVVTWEDSIGKGKQFKIEASSVNLKKNITITSYNDFPTMLFLQVVYTNTGDTDLGVDSWTNNSYAINVVPRNDDKPLFWSYQPGSYGWENDWIQPLKKGFERENYMGMNRVDYGGGTPVVDVWRQDAGLAVGHVEMVPKLVSLPVYMPTDKEAEMGVTYKKSMTLKPGESLTTFKTFVAVHHGDHFQTLSEYSRFMVRQGIEFREPPKGAYETIWCGWGYEKEFTMDEFYGTFPEIKKLGLDWVVLDYGWDTGVGDYYLDKNKFPNGDADMKKVVEKIHAIGAKAKLWWMPLSVYPCTDMFQKHSEYLLLNKDRSPVYIQFWRSFFLCPASEDVQKLTKEFVIKAMKDWGYDGLKIDGNHLNTVPPCYNRRHRHAYPEESVEKLPEFFKMIYETALDINPEAVIEICPCGTNQSFYILPYMNQTVSSDPSNSWQIRQKGKTLTALTHQKAVFYGDHVELSDDKSDFASTVGIGGVIGTKFVWPVGVHMNRESGDVSLTPEKEREWAKWIKIYNEKMLSKGIYRGDLYDIGYDRPETHAVQKDHIMNYAFYAPSFTGKVELQGLANQTYQVRDYVNDRDLGMVKGPTAELKVSFNKYLLIEVRPK